MHDLLDITNKFRKICLAQDTSLTAISAIQSLLRSYPFNFGGQYGSILGTANVGQINDYQISASSGLMAYIYYTANELDISAGTQINLSMNVSSSGVVKILGTPTELINVLNTDFAPKVQVAVQQLKGGTSSFPGITIPDQGVQFVWINQPLPADVLDAEQNPTTQISTGTVSGTPPAT